MFIYLESNKESMRIEITKSNHFIWIGLTNGNLGGSWFSIKKGDIGDFAFIRDYSNHYEMSKTINSKERLYLDLFLWIRFNDVQNRDGRWSHSSCQTSLSFFFLFVFFWAEPSGPFVSLLSTFSCRIDSFWLNQTFLIYNFFSFCFTFFLFLLL